MLTKTEGARGCGVRKPGALYLVAPELNESCSRLPYELDRCPHCGGGIGPARGWTWITPSVIIPAEEHGTYGHNASCPLGLPDRFASYGGLMHVDFHTYGHRMGERAGLIWIGEKFYPTVAAFLEEGAQMGISRRIKAVPRGFVLGETWVLLGHRKAILGAEDDPELGPITIYSPGIFSIFKPTAIEYVVKGTETDEEIEGLEKRGITPVKVVNEDEG